MEGDGQKETDKVEVKLRNLGTVNRNEVIIRKGNKSVSLYFSYETIVAVNDLVSENIWSMTTGKLLNELEPNKKLRVPHSKVLEEADNRIEEVLGVMKIPEEYKRITNFLTQRNLINAFVDWKKEREKEF